MTVVREVVHTPVVLAPVVEKCHHGVEQEEEEEKENEGFLEPHIELRWQSGLCQILRLWCGEIDTEHGLHVFVLLTALRSLL